MKKTADWADPVLIKYWEKVLKGKIKITPTLIKKKDKTTCQIDNNSSRISDLNIKMYILLKHLKKIGDEIQEYLQQVEKEDGNDQP